MKRAPIITYYWLPPGGSGVQRWLKILWPFIPHRPYTKAGIGKR